MKGRFKVFYSLLTALLLIGCLTSATYGDEDGKVKFGVSGFLGTEVGFIYSRPEFTKYGVLPRISIPLHRNWDLEVEGNFSYWGLKHEKNLYFVGVNQNWVFKPLHWNRGSLFLLFGGGLGYDNSGGDIREIGDSHFAGVAHAGLGIFYNMTKKWALRLEYRFSHISEPTRSDNGINSHDFLLGVSF
jgi:opacity protein-like surface antigen